MNFYRVTCSTKDLDELFSSFERTKLLDLRKTYIIEEGTNSIIFEIMCRDSQDYVYNSIRAIMKGILGVFMVTPVYQENSLYYKEHFN